MKIFLVLSVVVATALAAPNYGYQVVRTTLPPPPPPVRTPTYEAVRTPAYEAPKMAYEAVKAAPYEAPKAAPCYDSYGAVRACEEKKFIPILKHTLDTDHKGNYQLELETGNGIKGIARATVKGQTAEGPLVAKQGHYSYIGDDGKTYTVEWTADENGFHATGDHLPTAPPMPEEIRKSLEVPRIPEFQPDYKPEMKADAYGYGTRASYAPAAPPPLKMSSYSPPEVKAHY